MSVVSAFSIKRIAANLPVNALISSFFVSLLEGVVDSVDLSASLENLVQAQAVVSSGRFTLPLSAIRKQHKRSR